MRDLFFFRHYLIEVQNPNIAALLRRWGAKGYGLYWHLLERLYDAPSNMLTYDKALIKDLAKMTKLSRIGVRLIFIDMVSLRIMNLNDKFITCDRVDSEVREVIKARNKRTKETS